MMRIEYQLEVVTERGDTTTLHMMSDVILKCHIFGESFMELGAQVVVQCCGVVRVHM